MPSENILKKVLRIFFTIIFTIGCIVVAPIEIDKSKFPIYLQIILLGLFISVLIKYVKEKKWCAVIIYSDAILLIIINYYKIFIK